MKKLIYSFIALLAVGCSFMACDNEVEEYDIHINPITPDSAAAGVYEGTWTRMLLTDSSTVEGTGRVVIESDTAYLVALHFISEEFALDKSATANITYANEGFYYFNNSSTNDLKVTFYGSIDKEGVHTTSFVINQVENRRVKKFQYTFTGVKVADEIVKE